MTEELKACPYCEGKAEVRTSPRKYRKYYVKCLICGCAFDDEFMSDVTGCFEPFFSELEAITAWNNFCREQ